MRTRGEQFSMSPLTPIPGLHCPMGFLDYTRLIIFLPTTCFMAVDPSPNGPFHRLPCDMASACFQGKQSKREKEEREIVEEKHYQDGSHSLFRTSSQK